ncbi:FAD-binding domain-containing protein [Whalleya microplaca]|nr:FAD-binding domain-containing protein [Whalleya microplaca]
MKQTSLLALASAIAPATVMADLVDANVTVPTNCCSSLESAGLKNIYYPGNDVYENRTESYFSVSAQLEPICIIQPTSAEDVAKIVTTLTHGTACNFAVRSGGHTVWPGAANIKVGVTIDLGLISNTTYVPETQVAQVGAGSRWREVYSALEPYGVTAAGGRTSTVGVGGFLLGGGNTFYTARRGLACDNVVNYEVVLASGEIINANANENADLFKALKGGSANFGIVTRFDLQAFEAPELWGGLVGYPTSTTQQHIEAYVDWTDNIENYPDGSAITFWTYDPTAKDIIITAAYEDITGRVAAPAFDKFLAIPNQVTNTMRIASHVNLTRELELTSGYRNVWYAITFKNDKRLYEKAVELHKQFVADWKAQSPDGDFICHAIFQAIPTIYSKHSVEKGGNVLGLDREKDNAVMFQVQLMVNGEDQENLGRERMVAFRNAVKQYSADLGGDVEWEYLNYADYTQNPLKTYGQANVDYIRQVATKYDPDGVFQTRLPGGFKISKVL